MEIIRLAARLKSAARCGFDRSPGHLAPQKDGFPICCTWTDPTLAEHAENEVRKDFTQSERVAIAKAIEDALKAKRPLGRPKADDVQTEFGDEIPVKSPEFQGKESRQVAAEQAGFDSEWAYRQAKIVVEHAEPELVDAMDRGTVATSTAAKLAAQN